MPVMSTEEDAYLYLQQQQGKPIKNVWKKNSSHTQINDFWYLLINSY